MDNAFRMCARQPLGDLHGDPQRFGELHAGARNQVIERAARDKLHRDEVGPIGLRDFVDRDDVRMVQRGRRPRLLDKRRRRSGSATLSAGSNLRATTRLSCVSRAL